MRLELTHDDALVLFDWLGRLEDQDAVPSGDLAEKYVLWRLQAQLEKTLVEPFQDNYQELVEQARGRVRAELKAGGS